MLAKFCNSSKWPLESKELRFSTWEVGEILIQPKKSYNNIIVTHYSNTVFVTFGVIKTSECDGATDRTLEGTQFNCVGAK